MHFPSFGKRKLSARGHIWLLLMVCPLGEFYCISVGKRGYEDQVKPGKPCQDRKQATRSVTNRIEREKSSNNRFFRFLAVLRFLLVSLLGDAASHVVSDS